MNKRRRDNDGDTLEEEREVVHPHSFYDEEDTGGEPTSLSDEDLESLGLPHESRDGD